MRRFQAVRSGQDQSNQDPSTIATSPARDFSAECASEVSQIAIYITALMLLVAATAQTWSFYGSGPAHVQASPPTWIAAPQTRAAFDLHAPANERAQIDIEVLLHPHGGRKDVIRWSGGQAQASGGLQFYRPGSEVSDSDPAHELAAHLGSVNADDLQPAGLLDSKFGPVGLYASRAPRADGISCLGFARLVRDTSVQLSGWSCAKGEHAALTTTLSCAIERVNLLTAGSDPALASAFAIAERSRADCRGAGSTSSDWVSDSRSQLLRGTL